MGSYPPPTEQNAIGTPTSSHVLLWKRNGLLVDVKVFPACQREVKAKVSSQVRTLLADTRVVAVA
jgi:hypothetical protein